MKQNGKQMLAIIALNQIPENPESQGFTEEEITQAMKNSQK